ncbi:hypothetical protein [Mycolicibacter virginiensis]|uniref:hypothetical protein n=1 Tax=Mycolicibacter virginiensis TaxID=1795032 RepID=UPI001F04D3D4|nr:hypothetical protein [Mycolicibacter virginiensis]ULP45912.1 hypothetical protein MJO54_13635 [Mycolicibacter virginiensis]
MNEQQIINRLTNDIWPAVSLYNLQPSQSSPGAEQFRAVIDPNLRSGDTGAAYTDLRSAARQLGRQGEYDPQARTTHGNDGMTVAHAQVQSAHDHAAVLNVCYTYTHWWYENIADTQRAPGASEATLGLVNVDNTWYLHSISDDHVVPGCGAVNS